MINKKNIISTVILVGAIAISGVATYGVKSNADEETLTQVKMELQKQIDDKTKELEDKDKQLEELNNKVSGQEETINQLNNNITQLTSAVNSTQEDLNTTKQVQKADKAEVTSHADSGDAKIQKQVDIIKENQPKQLTEEEKKELEKGAHGTEPQSNKENNNIDN